MCSSSRLLGHGQRRTPVMLAQNGERPSWEETTSGGHVNKGKQKADFPHRPCRRRHRHHYSQPAPRLASPLLSLVPPSPPPQHRPERLAPITPCVNNNPAFGAQAQCVLGNSHQHFRCSSRRRFLPQLRSPSMRFTTEQQSPAHGRRNPGKC